MSLPRTLSLAVAALTLFSQPVTAQIPPATDAQREAGLRVESVQFEPSELHLVRGETENLTILLLDADGNRVEDAVSLIFTQGGISPPFAALTTEATPITATAAGNATVAANAAIAAAVMDFLIMVRSS